MPRSNDLNRKEKLLIEMELKSKLNQFKRQKSKEEMSEQEERMRI